MVLASVVIGATLLLLLYLSEQKDGLKPDRVAALPSQLPDNGIRRARAARGFSGRRPSAAYGRRPP